MGDPVDVDDEEVGFCVAVVNEEWWDWNDLASFWASFAYVSASVSVATFSPDFPSVSSWNDLW